MRGQNVTDHQVAGVISPFPKRTARRLWCIRLFGPPYAALPGGLPLPLQTETIAASPTPPNTTSAKKPGRPEYFQSNRVTAGIPVFV